MIGGEKKQIVYMGSDHAGFEKKEMLKAYLLGKNYDVTDLGAFNTEPHDYPDLAREVSEKVLERDGSYGILICGTGIGMAMTANKFRGIRAVNAVNEKMAEMGRLHNKANVLTLGARLTDDDGMKKIVDKFFGTEFDSTEERHVRRVNKIDG